MSAATPAVQEFFRQYAANRRAHDIGHIAAQYADSFLYAGPKGARVAEKQGVVASFPKGQAFLESLGHLSTEVLSLDESRIDEHYTLVRAQFAWHFQKAPAAPMAVTVDSTFILFVSDGQPRIVFQHEHEDFREALRAAGVLSAA